MKVIGIVGEYNPFHFGHAYHIEESRKAAGEDSAVVCVMSGDFVQRGEAALYSKFARAEAACRSGADLVLELPLPWSLSSAEGFARGALGILGNLGIVDTLSFGSECGSADALSRTAELLLKPETDERIRRELKENEGISFAAARQRALAHFDGDLALLLESPNNILGVEYIKAIYEQSLDITPVTVMRLGAGHDAHGDALPRSASEIRRRIKAKNDADGDIPAAALEVYERERRLGRGPVFADALEIAALSRLRMLPKEAFALLPDCGEGRSDRIAAAVSEESSLDAIAAAAKSKRYALSRIRRILMCASLGVRKGAALDLPPYARVLAANETGCRLLKEAKDKGRIPILTKPAAVKSLGTESLKLFKLGSDAHDFYVLGYAAREERRGGTDWRQSPKIL